MRKVTIMGSSARGGTRADRKGTPMIRRLRPRLVCVTLFLAALAAVAAGLAQPASAASGVEMRQVRVNETTLDHRVRLDPGQPAAVTLTVINNTDQVLRVRSVRLRGSVLGVTFYSAGTVLHLQVPARDARTFTVDVDLDDLGNQATGLLPLEVTLVGEDRGALATASGTADLRGSLWCAYGVFGLGLLVATVVAWVTALLALSRGRLSSHRWWRGVRFVWGGIGAGLVAVITLSVLRVIAPSAEGELAFVAGAAIVAFVAGYLTPRPADPAPRRPFEPLDDPGGAATVGAWTHPTDGYHPGPADYGGAEYPTSPGRYAASGEYADNLRRDAVTGDPIAENGYGQAAASGADTEAPRWGDGWDNYAPPAGAP